MFLNLESISYVSAGKCERTICIAGTGAILAIMVLHLTKLFFVGE